MVSIYQHRFLSTMPKCMLFVLGSTNVLHMFAFIWRHVISLFSFFLFLLSLTLLYFPASGQAVVTGVIHSPPRFLPSIFIAHRVQQSHCSSIFPRVLPTQRSRAVRNLLRAQEKVPTRHEIIRVLVCIRGDSNSRNRPIPGSKMT